MRGVWSSWVALAVAGALTGCGGGGGGGGGGTAISRAGLGTANERTGAANFGQEATRNYGLQQVGADAAQAAGDIGTGVTVGIVDTGIDVQHEDFTGAISAASTDIVSGVAANVDDYGGHGTAVAGVIGARRDGYDAVGVAPGSTLLAVRADSPGSCSGKCSFTHSDLAAATNYAVANGAQILNFSLGGDTLSGSFQAALDAAAAQGRIVVAAAGNEAGADPISPARWAATAGAAGLGIAVGAVDASNQLASFSNKAGIAKDHFLVAPGVNIVTSKNGGGVRSVSGTSFAAPHVAGAAAVVWGAAPYLTGRQVADILLDSATDLGAAGTDAVYGRGLLNLNSAMSPLGELTVPTGATVAEGGAPLAATALSLGGAFGNAAPAGLDGAVFMDAYGRPFHTDLSKAVATRKPASQLGSWLDQGSESTTVAAGSTRLNLSTPSEDPAATIRDRPGEPQRQPRFALSTDIGGSRVGMAKGYGLGALTGLAAAAPQAQAPGLAGDTLSSPYLGLAGDGSSMAASHPLGGGVAMTLGMAQDNDPLTGQSDRSAMLGEASKTFGDGSVLGIQAGTLTEADGPLATSGGGAFAFGNGAETVFTGVYAATPLSPAVTLFGRYSQGFTGGDALDGGLWRGGSTIRSESFALGATLRQDGGTWSLAASRPLRVTGGEAVMAVPVGRAMDGSVLYREASTSLAPSGAETDFELSWTYRRLILGGMMALQPGHGADAAPAYAVGAKYRLNW